MDMILTILILTMIMSISVTCGGAIQKTTHFLYPVDFVTILICIALVSQVFFLDSIPWDIMWSIPLMVGYFIGYLVSGRTKYVMIRQFQASKYSYAEAYVFYEKNSKTYLQVQSNKELMKRFLFGIQHEVSCPYGDLEPDWVEVTKFPLFPLFEKHTIYADSVDTFQTEREGRLKEYITEICKAPGSMISRTDLLRDFQALDRANKQLIETQNENYKLKQSMSTRMAKYMGYIFTQLYSTQPGARIVKTVRLLEQKRKEQEEADVKKQH